MRRLPNNNKHFTLCELCTYALSLNLRFDLNQTAFLLFGFLSSWVKLMLPRKCWQHQDWLLVCFGSLFWSISTLVELLATALLVVHVGVITWTFIACNLQVLFYYFSFTLCSFLNTNLFILLWHVFILIYLPEKGRCYTFINKKCHAKPCFSIPSNTIAMFFVVVLFQRASKSFNASRNPSCRISAISIILPLLPL